jgi:hypothetical protein
MHKTTFTVATLVALSVATTSCGGPDDATDSGSVSPATSAETAPSSAPSMTPSTTPSTTLPDTVVESSPPTSDPTDGWQEEVTDYCDELYDGIAAVAPQDGSATDIVRFVDELDVSAASLPPGLDTVVAPADVQPAIDDAIALLDGSATATGRAREAAAAGDVETAYSELRVAIDGINRTRGVLAMAGATCDTADPERIGAASLNVPTEGNTFMINSGFGSIWASRNFDGAVVRYDPTTGEVLATIDVGPEPQKLQPADGRMWVRTADRYVAIDPKTNTIVDSLEKAAVGPSANRSFALDGAMWICDGPRLHRYDPTTLQPVATVELDIECEEVFATDDLVVAYTTNEDPAQSGTSAAAFVDPTSNEMIATVDLPVDVAYPAVLESAVFFPGESGSTAVVVDRSSWTVSATPDLGRPSRMGLTATAGERIYVPLVGNLDVAVVDAKTFTVVDTVETLGSVAVVVLDGSMWVADSHYGLMQRHDLG